MKILIVDDNTKHLEAARVLSLQPGTDIEVLLSDLLMPAEAETLGSNGMNYLGHEIPIGLMLMLRAAKAGVRHVAVVTDTNHHNHPMSAAVDWINPAYWSDEENLFNIGETIALVAHAPLLKDGSKDWAAVMRVLMS